MTYWKQAKSIMLNTAWAVSLAASAIVATASGAETPPGPASVPSAATPVGPRIPDLSGATTGLTLIEDGKPRVAIITRDSKERATQAAQEVLAQHLGWMCAGAKVLVLLEDKDGPFTIQEGRVAAPPGKVPPEITTFIVLDESTALAKALGVTSAGLGNSGIRIKTADNAIVLVGANTETDNATLLHAVHEFLEMLGFRYLWPGELGKIIPNRSSVKVPPLDYSYTPPIGQRKMRFPADKYMDPFGKWFKLSKADVSEAIQRSYGREYSARGFREHWTGWQRLGGNVGIHGGHNGCGLGRSGEELAKLHPDWFALKPNGTRDDGTGRYKLCTSNPELIEHIANLFIEQVNKSPGTYSVDISPNDGDNDHPFCACANCKALDSAEANDSLTDRHVHFYNAIAERVAKVHPNLHFTVDAYSVYYKPPLREKVNPNLIVRYVPAEMDDLDGWFKAGLKQFFWRPNRMEWGKAAGSLAWDTSELAITFKRAFQLGSKATDFDGVLESWATQGLRYYICARMNWNPSLSYEEIVDDYCRFGFGPAAPHVKEYFLLCGRCYVPGTVRETEYLKPEVLGKLKAALDAATEAAAKDKTVSERVAFLRLGLNWNELYFEIEQSAAKAIAKEPYDRERAEQLMTLAFWMQWEMVHNTPLAVNVTAMVGRSSNFKAWNVLGYNKLSSALLAEAHRKKAENKDKAGNRDQALVERRLTGRERSLDEMLAAFGIKGGPVVVKDSQPARKTKKILEADENGQVREIEVIEGAATLGR